MANKPRSEKKAEKERREQEVLNRVFTLFLAGIAAECYVLLIYNKFVRGVVQDVAAYSYVVEYGRYIGALVMIAGLVLAVWKRQERSGRIGAAVAAAGAFFAFANILMFAVHPQGTIFLCTLIPILTVLGLVYFLFQREFFFDSVILGGTLFTLWLCRRGLGTENWNTKVTVGSILVLVGLAAAAGGLYFLQKAGGKFKNWQIFPKSCDYRPLYGSVAVSFVTIAAALVVPASAFYAMWIVGVAIFALAIYYTTKLM